MNELESSDIALISFKNDFLDEVKKFNQSNHKKLEEKAIINYSRFVYVNGFRKGFAFNKSMLENREKFIDWCIEHHPEVVKEYLGFEGE